MAVGLRVGDGTLCDVGWILALGVSWGTGLEDGLVLGVTYIRPVREILSWVISPVIGPMSLQAEEIVSTPCITSLHDPPLLRRFLYYNFEIGLWNRSLPRNKPWLW